MLGSNLDNKYTAPLTLNTCSLQIQLVWYTGNPLSSFRNNFYFDTVKTLLKSSLSNLHL